MQAVTVDRTKLLTTLKNNREKHVEEYHKAVEGYSVAAMRQLKEQLIQLTDKKSHRIVLTEYPPEDHTPDYDRALRMLEMSVQNHIVLTYQEFAQYVDDNWQWKHNFVASVSKYAER